MSEISFQQGLVAQQEQRMEHRMTQQQVQAASLLQRSELELRQELQAKLEANPVLELVNPSEISAGDLQDLGEESDYGDYCGGAEAKEGEENLDELAVLEGTNREENPKDREDEEHEEDEDAEYEEPEYGEESEGNNWGEQDESRRRYIMESLSSGQTLNGKLLEQLQGEIQDPDLSEACSEVIDRISADGRLQGSDEELAADMDLPLELVKKAVEVVQGLNPPGVAGRDLRETLLLQLKRDGREGSLEWKICDAYLAELRDNHLPQIAKALGCGVAEVQAAKDNIAKLKQYCGDDLTQETLPSILPDVFVYPNRKGGWEMRSNEVAFPVITISPDYQEMAQQTTLDKETKKWIGEKIGEGEQLIEALDYRKNTIERVAQQIVLSQQDYFRTGDERNLKPLLMKTIAERLKLDESTVSRAVAGKYMETPFGIREFRHFFSVGSNASAEGEELSVQRVQARIRELIQAENPAHPLSDEKIVKLLQDEKLNVARRTVAKYRMALHIPSTSKRKRHGGV